MANKAVTLEHSVLDHLYGLATWTAPTNIYFALFTAAPNDSGGGTEVTGGSYARVNKAVGSTNFQRSNSTVTNKTDIAFPAATADWGTITHYGGYTASTSGTLLFWAPLAQARTISSGDDFTLPANTGHTHTED